MRLSELGNFGPETNKERKKNQVWSKALFGMNKGQSPISDLCCPITPVLPFLSLSLSLSAFFLPFSPLFQLLRFICRFPLCPPSWRYSLSIHSISPHPPHAVKLLRGLVLVSVSLDLFDLSGFTSDTLTHTFLSLTSFFVI